MIKACGSSISFPLKLIFKSMVSENVFAKDWKKNNVVPIHKENIIKNYQLISLLPIFHKVFDRLDFSTLFNIFLKNKLFTPCQTGFIPGHSCVSQLLSITHEIYKNVDCHTPIDMRDTILDVCKAFYKV